MDAAEIDEVVLVGGSTRIPAVHALLHKLFPHKDLAQTVNPDEAVAVGAAVQAAVLDGDRSDTVTDLVLVDVTPLSLGESIIGGLMVVVIPRNTTIPCKRSKVFYTVEDYQSEVIKEIYEGERPMAEDNNFLGKFTLSGIHKAPRGMTSFVSTFEVDADGILHVTAVEKVSNQKNSITITREKGRFSTQEIDRLIRDAEALKEEDEKRKAAAIARNDLESKCYSMKKRFPNSYTLLKKVEEIMHWLETTPHATKADYDLKSNELDVLVLRL